MSIYNKNKLALKVRYQHGIDICQENPQTKRISQICKRSFKVRSPILSATQSRKTQPHFNKWYIDADLRYKKKSQDPKKNAKTLQKDQYLYKNLHNQQFWNWMHPLQGQIRRKQSKDKLSQKIDSKILEKFKNYMENKTNRRLPLVVQSALSKRI